jgi:hypothetical protein
MPCLILRPWQRIERTSALTTESWKLKTPMDKLLGLLGFTTPLIYSAATYGFFRWLDEDATVDAKAALAGAMKLKEFKSLQIANALVALFDKIYSYPLLSLRAFLRSALFTLIVTAAYAYEYLNTSRLLAGVWGSFFDDATYRFFLMDVGFYATTLLTNTITDYCSLFLIRECLLRLGGRPIFALFFGAIIGFDVVGLGVLLRTVLVGMYIRQSFEVLTNAGAFWFFAKVSLVATAPAVMVFAWLPLFALGILVIRALTPLSWLVTQVQWALRSCEEHPIRAVGCVAAAIVFFVTAGWRIIFLG